MPTFIGVSGAWKGVTSQWVGVGGVWKRIIGEWIGVGGFWKQIMAVLSVAASPTSVSGSIGVPGNAISGFVTATPSGGVGPYTYAWSQIAGPSQTATNPSGATTAFEAFLDSGTGNKLGTWQCTVTDTGGGSVGVSNSVTALLFWTG